MKYPYIGKWEYINTTVIFTDENAGIEIGGEMSFRDDWTEINYKNITAECLANTYGEVKSEGHANFLVALAKNNGLRVYEASHPIKRDYFTFSKYGKLFFFSKESQMDFKSRKQITIPLPPESNTNTPEEDFEMKQIAKNNKPKLAGVEEVIRDSLNENGDNLIFGDADKCKEWPCVGDEVVVESDSERYIDIKGKGVKVIGICNHSDGDEILTVEHKSQGVFAITKGDWIKKPKTPKQELEYNLTDLIMRARDADVDDVTIARSILSKYNITKKPQ